MSKDEKEKTPELKSFRLYIDDTVWKKVMYFIHKSDVEISGLGLVVPYHGGWRVIDTYLCEQENSASETEMDPSSIAKLEYDLRDKEGMLRWWWHSHVNMPAFWSGTDKECMEAIGRNGWFLSTVINKKEEKRSAFYGGSIIGGKGVFIDELETSILETYDPKLHEKWDAEYTKNVKKAAVKVWEGDKSRDWKSNGKKPTEWVSIPGCLYYMVPLRDTEMNTIMYEECEWAAWLQLFKWYDAATCETFYWDWVLGEWLVFKDLSDILKEPLDGKKKSKALTTTTDTATTTRAGSGGKTTTDGNGVSKGAAQ